MHQCSLPNTDADYIKDYFKQNENFFVNLKIKWLKWVTVSSDNPSTSRYYQSNNAIRLEKKKQLLSTFPYVIHPLSKFRMYYGFYVYCLYLAALIIKPIDISFERRVDTIFPGFKICTILLDGLCLIDVAIHFFMGYKTTINEQKRIILNLSAIARHYICSPYFWCDLVSSLPRNLPFLIWDKFLQTLMTVVTMLEFFKLIRLITVIQLMRKFLMIYTKRIFPFAYMVTTTIALVIIIHWLACIMFGVPRLYSRYFTRIMDESNAWIYTHGIYYNSTFPRQYHKALFRASALVLGVRLYEYKNHVHSNEDFVTSIIIAVIGKILVACLWMVVVIQVLSRRSSDINYHNMINELETYMAQRKFPPAVRKKILYYYRIRFEKKYFKEAVITSLLSENLRKEVKRCMCKSLIQNTIMFHELSSNELDEIVKSLELHIYLPNDTIMQAKTISDSMFFISCGTAAVYTHSGKEICHLQEGSYFGETSMLSGKKLRVTTVIAIETTEIYKLHKAEFSRILAHNKKFLKKITTLAQIRWRRILEVEKEYRGQVKKSL